MNRRRARCELLLCFPTLNHADNISRHYTCLLRAGSSSFVRSCVGDVAQGEDVWEFGALELEGRFNEDAAVGRVNECCAGGFCELGDEAIVGCLACS